MRTTYALHHHQQQHQLHLLFCLRPPRTILNPKQKASMLIRARAIFTGTTTGLCAFERLLAIAAVSPAWPTPAEQAQPSPQEFAFLAVVLKTIGEAYYPYFKS